MTRTSTDTRARRASAGARLFVLGGLGLAALYTAAALALDAGAGHIGPVWVAAIAWTVAASLAGALWRGFRRRDWSAFGRYELPDSRNDHLDWSTKTGAYSYMRHQEERERLMRGD